MAIAVQTIHPVAHVPLVLGVLRRLEVATVIDRLIPPHPAHGLSCGRGAEAMVLAMLDGHHALYKVGKRLKERGMVALLQPGLTRAALNDYRLGPILDALFAAISTGVGNSPWPWRDASRRTGSSGHYHDCPQAYEDAPNPGAPRPAYGQAKTGGTTSTGAPQLGSGGRPCAG